MPTLGLLKACMVLLGLGLFVVPWAIVGWDTWTASSEVNPSNALFYLANLSAGALGAAFAIVLGVKQQGARTAGTALTWPSAPQWTKIAFVACVWVYFLVGAFVLSAYLYDLTRPTTYAPQELKDFALVFAGYAAAYLAVLLAAGSNPNLDP